MYELEITGLVELIAAIQRLEQFKARDLYSNYLSQHLRPSLSKRFEQAAAQTPYSPRSLGTRKPATGVRRGSAADPGFSIDSGLHKSFMTAMNPAGTEIRDKSLSVFSPLPYSAFQEYLQMSKGPLAPDGVLMATEDDLDALEEMTLEKFEEIFSA